MCIRDRLCYDKLICKGIRLDPSMADVEDAMRETERNETLRALLHALMGMRPLAMYTLKTGKGIRTQVRARVFAARWLRGDVRGAAALERLRDGDQVLIAEGCTHHRQCEDIGTVKLPGWIRAHTGKTLEFAFTSGGEFPEALSGYSLVVHCGGCMLNEREVRYRMKCAADAGVPFTNYGITIAYLKGILRRSLSLFPELLAEIPPEGRE